MINLKVICYAAQLIAERVKRIGPAVNHIIAPQPADLVPFGVAAEKDIVKAWQVELFEPGKAICPAPAVQHDASHDIHIDTAKRSVALIISRLTEIQFVVARATIVAVIADPAIDLVIACAQQVSIIARAENLEGHARAMDKRNGW